MSSGLIEQGVYLLTNFGFLLGALPILVAGIMVLRMGHKPAGITLTVGAAMVVVEMVFWISDSVTAFVRSGSTYDTVLTDGMFSFLSALGAAGAFLSGAGVLLLALAFRAALKDAALMRGMVQGSEEERSVR